MALNDQGFTLIDLPQIGGEVFAAFDRLPIDPYCGGKQRYRRFSQYRLHFDGDWRLDLLPHEPFLQPRSYNSFVGGVLRHFEPLEIDPTAIVEALARAIPLDETKAWQINVHTIRVITTGEVRGVIVPEGPHRDGHQYAALVVLRRHAISGGRTMLLPLDGNEPFYETVIEPNQALVFDDRVMRHFTTAIEPLSANAYRDNFIVVFNEWNERHYGTAYLSQVLEEEVTKPPKAAAAARATASD
jgi:hypothetical protein